MTLYDPGIPGRAPAYIFFHAPRTGGNSIRRALTGSQGASRQLIGAHTPARDVLAHFEGRGQRAQFDTAIKFSVIRNPFDWLISLYSYITQNGGHPQSASVRTMKFPRFVQYYIEEWMQRPRPHGANAAEPFTEFLGDADGALLTDHVLRFEHLNRDAEQMLKRLGYAGRKVPHVNGSHHNPYNGYYDTHAKELVVERFSADLEHFNYKF